MTKMIVVLLLATCSCSTRYRTPNFQKGKTQFPTTENKPSTTVSGRLDQSRLYITYESSWYLEIHPDGSGVYGFGDGFPMQEFPSGTLNFTDVKTKLLAVSAADHFACPDVTFWATDSFSTGEDGRFVKEDEFSKALFVRAHQAATSAGMDEMIKRRPVFAHSEVESAVIPP